MSDSALGTSPPHRTHARTLRFVRNHRSGPEPLLTYRTHARTLLADLVSLYICFTIYRINLLYMSRNVLRRTSEPISVETQAIGIVEEFRRDEYDYDQAAEAIRDLFGEDSQEQEIKDAIVVYLGMLDEIIRDRAQSNQRGEQALEQERGDRRDPAQRGEPGLRDRDRRSPEQRSRDPTLRLTPADDGREGRDDRPGPSSHRRKRRAREITPDEEDTDAPFAHVRRKVDVSKYPFYVSNDLDDIEDEHIRATLRIKRNYMADIKQAKEYILGSAKQPNFPPAQLEYLLANQYVDLDKIHTFIYSVGSNKTHIGQIGDVELTYGESEVLQSRKIISHGEWSVAWQCYEDARVFVYPHHRSELIEYRRYITGLFASISTPIHGKVIDLDKAIRSFAGSSNTVRLDQTYHFNNLFTRYISSAGSSSAALASGSRSRNTATKPQGDTCIRWNRGAECEESSCKYRHACRKCGRVGHRASECRGGEAAKKGGAAPKS